MNRTSGIGAPPRTASARVSPDSGITQRNDTGCGPGVTWLARESLSDELHADAAKRAAGRVERAEIRLDDHLQRSARNGQARPRCSLIPSLIHPGTPASITVYRRPLSRRIDVVGRSHAVIPNPEKRKADRCPQQSRRPEFRVPHVPGLDRTVHVTLLSCQASLKTPIPAADAVQATRRAANAALTTTAETRR